MSPRTGISLIEAAFRLPPDRGFRRVVIADPRYARFVSSTLMHHVDLDAGIVDHPISSVPFGVIVRAYGDPRFGTVSVRSPGGRQDLHALYQFVAYNAPAEDGRPAGVRWGWIDVRSLQAA